MVSRHIKIASLPFWVAVALPGCLGIVLIALAGVHGMRSVAHHYREHAARELQGSSLSVVSAIEQEIDEGAAALERLLGEDVFADTAATYRLAKTAGEAFAGRVVLVKRDGERVFDTSVPLGDPLPDSPASHDLVGWAIASGARAISEAAVGDVADASYASVVVPISEQGSIRRPARGAILLFIPHSRFTRILRQHTPAGRASILTDANARVIAASFPQTGWTFRTQTLEVWQGLEPSNTGSGTSLRPGRVGQIDVVGTSVPLTSTGWQAATLMPLAEFQTVPTGPGSALADSGTMLLFLGMLSAVGVAHLAATPLRRLAKATAESGSRVGPAPETPMSSFPEAEQLRDAVIERNAAVCRQRDAEARALAAEKMAAKREEEVDYLKMAQKVGGIGTFSVNFKSRRFFWSDELWRLRGFDPETASLTYEEMSKLVHPDDVAQTVWASARSDVPAGGITQCENEFRVLKHDTGEWIRVRAITHVTYGEDGKPESMLGVQMDITRQAKLLAELKASEERFRLVVAAMQGGIFDRDLVKGTVKRTAEYYRVVGRDPGDLPDIIDASTVSLGLFIHPDDIEQTRRVMEEAILSDKESYYNEFRSRHRDGHWVHLAAQAVIVRDAAGKATRVVGSLTDITPRREAELALRRSEERLRLAQENAGIGVFEIDLLKHKQVCSAELYRMFGLHGGQDELTDFDLAAYVLKEDAHKTVQSIILSSETAVHGAIRTEYRGRTVTGDAREFLAYGRGFWDGHGKLTKILGIQIDVTELKNTERDAQRHAELWKLSLAAASAGFWEWDIHAGRLEWSPETFSLLGRDQSLGTPTPAEWPDLIHPDDKEAVIRNVEQCLSNPSQGLRVEFRVKRPDGSVATLLNRGSVTLDEQGRPKLMRGILVDITERLEAEQAQALLMREVDHRAKNALASVLPILRLTKADTIGEYVDAVEARVSALGRAHELLARAKWSGASLRGLLEQELRPYMADAGRVRMSGPPVRVAPSAVQSLSMVLHEMTTNAAKYGALSRNGGTVTISWSLWDRAGEWAQAGLQLTWQERGGPPIACVPSHKGFGSVLIRLSVVNQLRGELRTDWGSEGAEWQFTLPPDSVIPGSGPRDDSGCRAPSEAGQAATQSSVLVVEDEAMIAFVMAEAIAEKGWHVVGPAGSLAEAMAVYEKSPDIGLAILDVNLRGEMVFPLARRLMDDGVPIVFMTGYGGHAGLEEFRDVCTVLTKPVLPSDVVRAVLALSSHQRRRANNRQAAGAPARTLVKAIGPIASAVEGPTSWREA